MRDMKLVVNDAGNDYMIANASRDSAIKIFGKS